MRTSHKYRRSFVHSLFVILLGVIGACALLMMQSCTPSKGCASTRGMAGYSYLQNLETGRVAILDREGNITICYDKPMTKKEIQEYFNNKY